MAAVLVCVLMPMGIAGAGEIELVPGSFVSQQYQWADAVTDERIPLDPSQAISFASNAVTLSQSNAAGDSLGDNGWLGTSLHFGPIKPTIDFVAKLTFQFNPGQGHSMFSFYVDRGKDNV